MINELYDIQQELNQRIIDEHNLKEEDIVDDRFLAFFVELGELANETRTFKYWSLKPASADEVILEEYSDGLHFLLTIGLSLDRPHLEFYNQESDQSLTELFLSVYNDANIVRSMQSKFVFVRMYNTFMLIAKKLGFSEQDVYDSYMRKNEINHQRQDDGY